MLHTFSLVSNSSQDPFLQKKIKNTFNLIKFIRAAKYLTTISAMMFSTIQGMKLFITFKTVIYIFVLNPLLSWTERGFYYLFNLIVHLILIQYKNEKKINIIVYLL